jgi:hypothetical protein
MLVTQRRNPVRSGFDALDQTDLRCLLDDNDATPGILHRGERRRSTSCPHFHQICRRCHP